MNKIFREQIDKCISQCTQIIANTSRHVDGYYGWHQHLGTKKIDIVATAMVLLYYKRLGLECPEKDRALDFIKSKAKRENDDCIGWPYISNTHGNSNVESTCWALLALYSYLREECSELIGKGFNWIISQYQSQTHGDNGWGFTNDSIPRIYITAFVLRTLTKLGRTESEEYESALSWLKSSQNDDGGWGELPDRGSSLFYTSYVVLTLLECGGNIEDSIIRDAKHWLDQRMKDQSVSDSSLLCYLEFIESGTGENRTRITFFHYVSPYILQAYSKLDPNSPYIYTCLESCLKYCKDGMIEHPMLENSKITPVWAIYDTVSGFEVWKKSYSDWDKLCQFSIFFKRLRSFRKYNPIRFLASSYKWILNGILLIAVIWTILYFSDTILSWLNMTEYNGWGQLIISFGASTIYGLLGYLLGRLRVSSR